jgi:hypothetical protein
MRVVVRMLLILLLSACATTQRGDTGAGVGYGVCIALGGSKATCGAAAAGSAILGLSEQPHAGIPAESLSKAPTVHETEDFCCRTRGISPTPANPIELAESQGVTAPSHAYGSKANSSSVAASERGTTGAGMTYAACIALGGSEATCTRVGSGSAVRGMDDYKVVLGADARIKLPGPPGELRIWIGNPRVDPNLPSDMTRAEGAIPAIGQTAKVLPFAPAFEIDPAESICMAIDPTGSVVRFRLKPTKIGTFNVGADVKLFNSPNCSGTPVPKTTETLQVQVIVDSDEVFQERTKQLGKIFWDKFLEFWGFSLALFFALFLFLIKGRLKKWFSFENDK